MIVDMFMSALDRIKVLFSLGTATIQPKDILNELVKELDHKKKNLMDDNVFVPDHYTITLSHVDYDDIAPFISSLKEQLESKLNERINKKGYRLLAPLIVEITFDQGIEMNYIEIFSVFHEPPATVKTPDRPKPLSTVSESTQSVTTEAQLEQLKPRTQYETEGRTHIFEETPTKYIDMTELTLEVVAGENIGEIIPLQSGVYTVGRGRNAKIKLIDEEETISREHFEIAIQNGTAIIRDLMSKNGTLVNNITLTCDTELKQGDTITAGKVLLKVV